LTGGDTGELGVPPTHIRGRGPVVGAGVVDAWGSAGVCASRGCRDTGAGERVGAGAPEEFDQTVFDVLTERDDGVEG